jgi:Putative adhesin
MGGQPYLWAATPALPSRAVSTARIVALAALTLLVLCGAAFLVSEVLHRDAQSNSVITGAVHRIVVNNDAGDVDIRAGLTSDVMVSRHDSWLLDRPTVSERYANGTLSISTKCGTLKAVLRCRANLVIDAPPEVDVVVRAGSGNVDLRGLSGRADIETKSGDIRTHRLNPVTVRAETDAGNVSLDLFGQPTRTMAISDAGDVRVVVPYGPYRVDANTDGGKVKVEGVIRDDLAPQTIDAVTSAGNILVRAR